MQPILLGIIILTGTSVVFPSQDCLPRHYGKDRIVCVCNKNYCDTLEPVDRLPEYIYWKYTSNKAGNRLKKVRGYFSNNYKNELRSSIEVKSDLVYQKIIGFGGTFSDATGINIKSLDEDLQKQIMTSYFSENGIEYSLGRVAMAANDFSTHPYTYHDEEDLTLSNFSLAEEDYKYKLPLLHIAKELTKDKIKVLTSSWIAPKWMKSNGDYTTAPLKESMYQVWADYHLKFIEAYEKENITFWLISNGNEPKTATTSSACVPLVAWQSTELRKWLRDNLGPTIKNSNHSDTKILVLDDMRLYLEHYVDELFLDTKVREYADGIAVHGYFDRIVPATLMDSIHSKYPEKFLISTEYSEGGILSTPAELGLWERAEAYAFNIIQNMNHWSAGWVDWNMVLDLQGGPTYVSNFCDAPILVNATAQEFYKQPMFYAMGHFSKFVPPDSRRIYASSFLGVLGVIPVIAFQRPDGGMTVVVVNKFLVTVETVIVDKNRGMIPLQLSANSITTIVYW